MLPIGVWAAIGVRYVDESILLSFFLYIYIRENVLYEIRSRKTNFCLHALLSRHHLHTLSVF
jgi:hypothetical protein